MIQGPELPFLRNWQNFHMVIGTAAATLAGWMFVATSLAAGIEAFNTPTVVHFGAVLLIAGLLSVPWQVVSIVGLLLGLLSLAALMHLLVVVRRMRRRAESIP